MVLLLVAASACGSGHHPGDFALSQGGQIGPLRMDQSTRADVVALVGRPDAERRDRYESAAPYRALGYACAETFTAPEFPLGSHGPYCRTVYWINQRTGRLGDFYTSSARYYEIHGVRIGTPTAKAERLVHKLAYVGCEENIYLGKGGRSLTIAFDGGSPRKLSGSDGLHLVGGHVFAFALHGPRSDVGVFDCL
jgi:hypothetical protein